MGEGLVPETVVAGLWLVPTTVELDHQGSMVTVKVRDIASDELLSGGNEPRVGCPDFSSRSGSMSVIPSGVEESRTVCGAQGTILRTTERAGFAEVVPCALKTGRDPSTSVGTTEGARLLRTFHHDLMNDEPREENRQPAQRKAATDAAVANFCKGIAKLRYPQFRTRWRHNHRPDQLVIPPGLIRPTVGFYP